MSSCPDQLRASPTVRQTTRYPPLWLMVPMFVLIGVNSRSVYGAVPAVLPEIRAQLGLSGFELGLLTALPTLCMGLLAPPAQRLAARIGAERALGIAFAFMTLAHLTRLGGSNELVLFFSSLAVGAAMGAASALVPALIGHHVSRSYGLVTGAYSTAVAGGSALAAWAAMPLATALGGWQQSLAAWSLGAAMTVACWFALMPRLRRTPEPVPEEDAPRGPVPSDPASVSHRMPWHSRTARWITVFVSLQSLVAFSGVAWMLPTFRAEGWSPDRAATITVIFLAIQAASTLVIPSLCDRFPSRRPFLVLSAGCTLAGVLALAISPGTTSYLAVVLFGAGIGGGFAMGFVLIVDSTATKADAARLSAMVFLVAYLVAATGPLAVGLMYDVTGGFTGGYVVLAVFAAAQLLSGLALRPGRTLYDDQPPLAATAAVRRS